MTAPRQVLPGTSYLVTRRCSERRFFLRPSDVTNGIFLYVLAVAAHRFGVVVHAYCVLSNHYHLIVTDPDARLPAFMQYLDSLVARAMNAWLGRWEAFWSTEASYSAVVPVENADIVRKAAYVLANPVAAGLVSAARDWPGLWTAPEQLGAASITVPRPKVFFGSDSSLPESVELTLKAPNGFASAEDFRSTVSSALAELEDSARRELATAGRTFEGRARVLATSPFSSPSSREPRRTLNPRVAAKDPGKRVDSLSRLAAFVDAYREAWAKLRSGVRDVLFPAGTYRLRIELGVRCAAPA